VSLSPAIGIPATINKLSFKHHVLCIIIAIAPASNLQTKQNRCFEIKNLNRAVLIFSPNYLANSSLWLCVILFAPFRFQFFKDGLLLKIQKFKTPRFFHPHFYRNDSAVNISI